MRKIQDLIDKVRQKLKELNLRSREEWSEVRVKPFVTMAASLFVLFLFLAAAVFQCSVRGTERVIVPDVRGKELTAALIELQTRELYPRIQLRSSQVPHDKGTILEQIPRFGTTVKAGRRIRLVVSQGAILGAVANYTGRNIDEARVDIQALNANQAEGAPLYSVKEPLMLAASEAPAGQILEQEPAPGTPVTGPTALEFVVSLGPESETLTVPAFTGLSLAEALRKVASSGVNFTFLVRPPEEGERAGAVVSQEPQAGLLIPASQLVTITFTPPDDLAAEEVFGLFTYQMAKTPYPLEIRLEVEASSEERRRLLLAAEYSGGDLAVPYRVPRGSSIILSVLGREYHRIKAGE